ncbi:hypothetical protein GCM10020221_18530 [Streptomyces thioluteus]|uniref:Uncharacterized protein n=1 Tax=Streptomyces thioluteus TaxID=66431 RepID=A0ABN3WPR2_STRTU
MHAGLTGQGEPGSVERRLRQAVAHAEFGGDVVTGVGDTEGGVPEVRILRVGAAVLDEDLGLGLPVELAAYEGEQFVEVPVRDEMAAQAVDGGQAVDAAERGKGCAEFGEQGGLGGAAGFAPQRGGGGTEFAGGEVTQQGVAGLAGVRSADDQLGEPVQAFRSGGGGDCLDLVGRERELW